MVKRGIVRVEATGSFDMGDGTYLKNASKFEIIESSIGNRVVYYVTQLEAISLVSTDNKNWTEDTSTPQDGAYTDTFIGSTLNGVLKRKFDSQIVTWDTPLTEVTQAV